MKQDSFATSVGPNYLVKITQITTYSQGGSTQKIGSTVQVREANSNIAINEVSYILFQNQHVGSAHMSDTTIFRGYAV